ncbi:hypothetical protein SELMODRAFT_404900 [Selaginella moellendorffii]|uniref:Uncharacterized protein n=1 Tax=Selaginella moellendorffii TaxID=88036 RepID=D8QXQ8_SELML|nr:hypothetical protein SELMODRAFT_404900 [Selaginella moellendorffii]
MDGSLRGDDYNEDQNPYPGGRSAHLSDKCIDRSCCTALVECLRPWEGKRRQHFTYSGYKVRLIQPHAKISSQRVNKSKRSSDRSKISCQIRSRLWKCGSNPSPVWSGSSSQSPHTTVAVIDRFVVLVEPSIRECCAAVLAEIGSSRSRQSSHARCVQEPKFKTFTPRRTRILVCEERRQAFISKNQANLGIKRRHIYWMIHNKELRKPLPQSLSCNAYHGRNVQTEEPSTKLRKGTGPPRLLHLSVNAPEGGETECCENQGPHLGRHHTVTLLQQLKRTDYLIRCNQWVSERQFCKEVKYLPYFLLEFDVPLRRSPSGRRHQEFRLWTALGSGKERARHPKALVDFACSHRKLQICFLDPWVPRRWIVTAPQKPGDPEDFVFGPTLRSHSVLVDLDNGRLAAFRPALGTYQELGIALPPEVNRGGNCMLASMLEVGVGRDTDIVLAVVGIGSQTITLVEMHGLFDGDGGRRAWTSHAYAYSSDNPQNFKAAVLQPDGAVVLLPIWKGRSAKIVLSWS